MNFKQEIQQQQQDRFMYIVYIKYCQCLPTPHMPVLHGHGTGCTEWEQRNGCMASPPAPPYACGQHHSSTAARAGRPGRGAARLWRRGRPALPWHPLATSGPSAGPLSEQCTALAVRLLVWQPCWREGGREREREGGREGGGECYSHMQYQKSTLVTSPVCIPVYTYRIGAREWRYDASARSSLLMVGGAASGKVSYQGPYYANAGSVEFQECWQGWSVLNWRGWSTFFLESVSRCVP